MWKGIDDVIPPGVTQVDVSQERTGTVLWFIAGAGLVIVLLLLVDALLSWHRNRNRLKPRLKRVRFVYFRKFLAWLLYPSFQSKFKTDE